MNGDLRVLDGAGLQLRDRGWLWFDDDDLLVDSDSFIQGDGFVRLGSGQLNNSGRITATNGEQISFSGNGVNLNLDGDGETGFLQATEGGELWFSGQMTDAFDGQMEIGSSSRISMEIYSPSLGAANIEFSGESAETAGRISLLGDVQSESHLLTFHATGHGRVDGVADEQEHTVISGPARINVEEGGSLTFGEDGSVLETNFSSGSWRVEQDGVLDFKDTLGTAEGVQVRLNGGTIKGEGSNALLANNEDGIRGFGRFELPLVNNSVIAAEGGTLFVDASSQQADWDGTNDTGRWDALQGDLHILAAGSGEMKGNVRVGLGNELFMESSVTNFSGNVQLNGGKIRSEQAQFFTGSMDVIRESVIDARAGFQNDVTVNLEQDLILKRNSVFLNSSFGGAGNVVVDDTSRLLLTEFADINVDVLNYGEVDLEDSMVLVDGDVSSFASILFDLEGANVGEYGHLDITGTLLADGDAMFGVYLEGGFNPLQGDEFDLLDFGMFLDMGYTWDLPSLDAGLAWDTSDFSSHGVIRVASSIPEPCSGFVLLAFSSLFCFRTSRQR